MLVSRTFSKELSASSSGSPKVNKEFWCECFILLFWTFTFGMRFYWYLVLLGAFSKEEHKFHGVGSPLGEYFENRQPAKPRMSLFEDRLLSHSDTGFRIYVKNWLYWYQGHVLKSFLRRAVTHRS